MFTDVGRRSVPPMIVAVVMVLQRLEGCSDREAVERFAYDLRWKYAAGGLDFDYPSFVHTVLVDMRARLAASGRPDRVFEVTLAAAKEAGLVGRRRVLDSTALYDAVATMDTVTLIRSAIRGYWLRARRGRSGSCGRSLPAMTITDLRASRCVIGRTGSAGGARRRAGSRRRAVLGMLDGRALEPALRRRASCWRRWSGRIWRRVRTAGSGSRGRSRRTG